MYEVGVAQDFNASHDLEGDESPSSHEHGHGHGYRAEVVIRGAALDEAGMLLDIDLLRAALAASLVKLDGADLDDLEDFAGQSTTVEILAGHIWTQLRDRLVPEGKLESLRVTVHESNAAWASVDRSLLGVSPVR